VEFAEKALNQIVLIAFNAVSGFMEGAVVYLVDYRMWLGPDVRGLTMGSSLEKLWPLRNIVGMGGQVCYLGVFIGAAGGGAEIASRERVRCAWAKFRDWLQFKGNFSQSERKGILGLYFEGILGLYFECLRVSE